MTRFPEVLSELQRRLPLPQPAQSRILLEVSGDLEGLYRHYLSAGLDEAAARERAVAEMSLTPDVLADLIDIHTSPYQRFLDGLSERARSRWERGMLVLLCVFACSVVFTATRSGPIFETANIFVWPALFCFGVGLLIGLQRSYVLFIRKAHAAREARRGLSALLFLAVSQFIIGIAGTWLDLLSASQAVVTAPDRIGQVLLGWIVGGTALMLLSLGGCVVTALWWIVLAGRVAAVEDDEAYALTQISGAGKENR